MPATGYGQYLDYAAAQWRQGKQNLRENTSASMELPQGLISRCVWVLLQLVPLPHSLLQHLFILDSFSLHDMLSKFHRSVLG